MTIVHDPGHPYSIGYSNARRNYRDILKRILDELEHIPKMTHAEKRIRAIVEEELRVFNELEDL